MELKTLVLTLAMQPQGIVTWRKAVTLAFKSRVDVLDVYTADVDGGRFSIELPAVIKLRQMYRMHKDGVKFSRANVYQRDDYRCCYCNKRFLPKQLNYDHVVPRVQGGKTVWENIVTACYPCNGRKAGKTAFQAGMRMHYVPYRPHVLSSFRPLVVDLDRVPSQWLPYLQHQQQAQSA